MFELKIEYFLGEEELYQSKVKSHIHSLKPTIFS